MANSVGGVGAVLERVFVGIFSGARKLALASTALKA